MVFQLPVVKKCCCCTSLRVGCFIIGYGILVLSVVSIIGVIISLVFVIHYVNGHKDKPDLHHTPEEIATAALSLYVTHAYYILVYLYHICINLVLVVGVHSDNSKYLRLYFKCGLVLLSLEVILIVVTTIFISPLVSIYSLAWSTLMFYFLIVVRSTAIKMEENNKPITRGYEMNSVYNPHQSMPLMA